MELRLCKYFLTVAREGTILGAAQALHMTQPTLSRQMMQLEADLGITLFHRGKRSITLTDDGMRFRKRAEEIVELVEQTQAEFAAPGHKISGDVFIGGGETPAMRLIAGLVKGLYEAYPQIRFHFYSGNAEDVTERLDKGLLDFGILIQPAHLAKYASQKLPASDTWGVLMRQDSALAAKPAIRPEDLWDQPLISSRQRLVSRDIAQWIKKDYEKLNLAATYNLVYNASLLVEAGLGYALCLEHLVNITGNSELCFRPLDPPLKAELHIIWKKNQVFSNAARLFLERIQSAY